MTKNTARLGVSALLCAAIMALPSGQAWAQQPNKSGKSNPPKGRSLQKPPKDFSRKALIKPLLDKLAETKDAGTAKALGDALTKLWARSGSPTVDLLMKQVDKAMAKKDAVKALALLDAVIEIAPEFAEGWNRRATVLFLKQSYDASMADISRVLELQPRHFGALSGLGMVMRALGDKKSALAAFRRALAIHPFMRGPARAVKELAPEVEGQGI